MKVTIIPVDGFVNVDGVKFFGLDLSFIDSSVHAVQWNETQGEIEIKDAVTDKIIENQTITSFDIYQPAIDLWQTAKTEYDANLAAEQAAIQAAMQAAIDALANSQPETIA